MVMEDMNTLLSGGDERGGWLVISFNVFLVWLDGL